MGADGASSPWYAKRGVLIGGGIAAGLGVILLVIGVVSFVGASSTRDEADELKSKAQSIQDEAQSLQDEADADEETAAALPELVADVDSQTDGLVVLAGATTAAFNGFIDCANASGVLQEAASCYGDPLAGFQSASDAEVAAVQQLGVDLADAESAVKEAAGD